MCDSKQFKIHNHSISIKKINEANKEYKKIIENNKSKIKSIKNKISNLNNERKFIFETPQFYKYKYNINKTKNPNNFILSVIGKDFSFELINENQIKKIYPFNSIGTICINNNEDKIGISIDDSGNEKFNIYYKNYFTKNWFLLTYPKTYKNKKIIIQDNFIFSPCSNYIYFLSSFEDRRTNLLWIYSLLDKCSKVLYEIQNFNFSIYNIYLSKDRTQVLLNVGSKDENNIYIIKEKFKLYQFIEMKIYNFIHLDYYRGTWILLVTNLNKNIFFTGNNLKSFKKIYSISDYEIKNFYLFQDYIVISYLQNNLLSYKIFSKDFKNEFDFQFPDKFFTITIPKWANLLPCNNTIYLNYQSPLCSESFLHINLDKIKNKTYHISKNSFYNYDNYNLFNPNLYKISYLKCYSNSTNLILIHSKKFTNNSKSPCFLLGYGSYGTIETGIYSHKICILLQNNFIIGIPFLRGGGNFGINGYLEGKMKNKKNTFTDLNNITRFLINNNYCDPKKITLMGESAGGLLVGSSINIDPSLYNLAIMGVPFVNVLSAMCNKNLPLTKGEYKEWGNPNIKNELNTIAKYDPILNINNFLDYPNIFIFAFQDDMRIDYRDPYYYYLKLKEALVFKNKKKDILFYLNPKFGHAGPNKYQDNITEEAILLFLILHYN